MKQIAMFDELKPKRRRRSSVPAKAKKLSQYYTQPQDAERIARFALEAVPDARTVLEPSAGNGALVAALLKLRPQLQITAVDIDIDNAMQLLRRYPQLHVCCCDFLAFTMPEGFLFDVVVMNPPFENGSVAAHVGRALGLARHVVCHCPLTTLAGQDRRERLWSICEPQALAACSTRPKYLGDGGKTDMCTLYVTPTPFGGAEPRDPSERRPITLEFWP